MKWKVLRAVAFVITALGLGVAILKLGAEIERDVRNGTLIQFPSPRR